jgi:mRNA interferase MazF
MTPFEAGDVVRVPFPHVETNARRFRPALVVTRTPIAPDALLIWVVMITSAERNRWPGDIPIDDQKSAGLPIPSMIRSAKIATLEAASAQPIGRLSVSQLPSVMQRLSLHLGLA